MTEHEIINTANNVTVQRLLEHLSAYMSYATIPIAGATITVEPSRYRTGIPADAACRRYVITNVAEGWSMVARTVWRNNRLYQPAATHTRIDHYLDDDDRHGGDDTVVAEVVNDWLRGLPL